MNFSYFKTLQEYGSYVLKEKLLISGEPWELEEIPSSSSSTASLESWLSNSMCLFFCFHRPCSQDIAMMKIVFHPEPGQTCASLIPWVVCACACFLIVDTYNAADHFMASSLMSLSDNDSLTKWPCPRHYFTIGWMRFFWQSFSTTLLLSLLSSCSFASSLVTLLHLLTPAFPRYQSHEIIYTSMDLEWSLCFLFPPPPLGTNQNNIDILVITT